MAKLNSYKVKRADGSTVTRYHSSTGEVVDKDMNTGVVSQRVPVSGEGVRQGTGSAVSPSAGSSKSAIKAPLKSPAPAPVPVVSSPLDPGAQTNASPSFSSAPGSPTPNGLLSVDQGVGYQSKFGELAGDTLSSIGAFSGVVPNPELVARTQDGTASFGENLGAVPGTVLGLGGSEFVMSSIASKISSMNIPNVVRDVFSVGKMNAKGKVPLDVVTNTKSIAQTESLLNRLLSDTKIVSSLNPATGKVTERIITTRGSNLTKAAVVTVVMGMIGTYPWNAHLKTDNMLTTISMAKTAAFNSGDPALIAEAQDLFDAALDPSFTNKILDLVPGVNILNTARRTFEAAAFHNEVTNKVFDDLSAQKTSGESDTDFYARLASDRAAEKEAERKADEEYYANIARLQAEAKAASRASDEAYWNNILAKKEKAAAEKQKASDAYWSNYYKELAKVKSSSKSTYEPPSNLGFGLI